MSEGTHRPARPNASQYEERDMAILRHIDRYGLGLMACISKIFMKGQGHAGHIIRRLAAANLVRIEKRALPGNHSYALLTSQGYKRLGKEKKYSPLTANALDNALAVLYWCVLESATVRRYRLSPRQIEALFPAGGCAPNVTHVLTEEFGLPVMLRVYNATASKSSSIAKNVVTFFEESRRDQRVATSLLHKDLGLLVLLPTSERCTQIKRLLSKEPTLSDVRLVLGVGATAATWGTLTRKAKGNDHA